MNVDISQTNFQQFRDGFDLQDGPFPQCVIIVEFARLRQQAHLQDN
jgi:hypothetical protein